MELDLTTDVNQIIEEYYQPLLSILIPSIPPRSSRLLNLVSVLNEQSLTDEWRQKNVEIVTDATVEYLAGGLSIGKKRESLIQRASGKYSCFLDDDESIAPNYIEVLLQLCRQDKDVCTFQSLAKLEYFWTVIDMSLKHKVNQQARPGITKRTPWHICPVRTEYAKLYPFEDSNYGEDWKWFEKVLTHCKTQARSKLIIHQYNHKTKEDSEADRIVKSENFNCLQCNGIDGHKTTCSEFIR